MSRVLVILGMHRSGTSLITQWLYKCGLQIGDELDGSGTGNPDGHFEDLDFMKLHASALEHAGISNRGLEPVAVTELNPYYKEKLLVTIELKNRLYNQWGWKDPRTCLFLSVYRALDQKFKYLIITRDYNSIVSSLLVRDFENMERSYLQKAGFFNNLVWRINRKRKRLFYYQKVSDGYLRTCIKYNEELLLHIRTVAPHDYLVINYQMLIDHSKEVFSYMKNNWQFQLEYVDFNKIYKPSYLSKKINITDFISDKSLLQKAVSVETELKKYEFNELSLQIEQTI